MWENIKKYAGYVLSFFLLIISILLGTQKVKNDKKQKDLEKKIRELNDQILQQQKDIATKKYEIEQAKLNAKKKEELEALELELKQKLEKLKSDQDALEKYTKDQIGTSTGPGTITRIE